MDKHRTHIFIALVLILLIIAAICAWVTGSSINNDAPEATAAPETDPAAIITETPTNESEDDTPSAEPVDTPEPEATKKPVETAKPQETKKPEPTPDSGENTRLLSQSGSFEGSTGTNLSTRADWKVTSKNDSELSLTVTLYAYSYTMGIGQRSGVITVNGTPHQFNSASINVKSDNRLVQTKLYSLTVTIPCELGQSVSIPISTDWNFNGVYNKKDIGTVSGSSVINIQG